MSRGEKNDKRQIRSAGFGLVKNRAQLIKNGGIWSENIAPNSSCMQLGLAKREREGENSESSYTLFDNGN
jgi:hypothetical protein